MSSTFAQSFLVAPPEATTLEGLLAEADGHLDRGEPGHASTVLERARTLAESDELGDADRAAVFFGLGRCRLALGSVANAASLFTLALDLCDRSGAPCDRLRADLLDWRSRCAQRQRDWEAARADVERALELVQALGEPAATARIYFQASIVAERQGQLLVARFYAEEARELLCSVGDWGGVGKVLNNLGGINVLLGDLDAALLCLDEALRNAELRGSALDTGYALSSRAQLSLRTGDPAAAARDAARALQHLGDRTDHANEIASAELVLARALAAQNAYVDADAAFRRAHEALEGFGSPSHSAAAWLVGGDIARAAGDAERAADLYRRAAAALQDVRF